MIHQFHVALRLEPALKSVLDETAEVLKLSPQSVMRDWKLARAWLMVQLMPAR
jgi:hypothetical protein